MRSQILLFALLLVYSIAGIYSATIFDHRLTGRRAVALKKIGSKLSGKLNKIENDHSKRHISTFRVLDSDEKDELARKMEDKTQKFNDDTSNERNIWRSHPQKLDFEGPDTASVIGLDF